jgi:hypothetical protein
MVTSASDFVSIEGTDEFYMGTDNEKGVPTAISTAIRYRRET